MDVWETKAKDQSKTCKFCWFGEKNLRPKWPCQKSFTFLNVNIYIQNQRKVDGIYHPVNFQEKALSYNSHYMEAKYKTSGGWFPFKVTG